MSDQKHRAATDDRHPQPLFALREGRIDGGYAVAMVDHALKDYRFRREYPWHLSLDLRPKNKTPEGLPTDEEAKELNAFEDLIDDALKRAQSVHFVARETRKDLRRVHWYLKDPAAAANYLRGLIERHDYSREFEFTILEDPEWNEVASLLDYSVVQ